MPDSTTPAVQAKPAKLPPGFPLTRRGDGRWCKRVRGKFVYFRGTPDEALAEWLRTKDDLLAGRKPRPLVGGVNLDELVNRFLALKRSLVESGELTERSYGRYFAACKSLLAAFGRQRVVIDLRPEDFQRLRHLLAKRFSLCVLATEIQIIRMIFKFGADEQLTGPVHFGQHFKKPSVKSLAIERLAKGPRDFTPEQIRALLDHAKPDMKAMILLGANCGLGNSEMSLLTPEAFDFADGWLDYPRSKTAVPRRIPIWPETVQAVRDVLAKRRAGATMLFVGPRGDYLPRNASGRIATTFAALTEAAGVEGRTFYDLRRSFQTVAENSGDYIAVSAIMGHRPLARDMAARYRQRVTDERLLNVTNTVRRWLFPDAIKPKTRKAKAK